MVYNIFSLLGSCPVWEILFNNIMPCGAADKEINVNINHAFVSRLISAATDFGLKLIAAAVILVIGFKLSKYISKKALKSKYIFHCDEGVKRFVLNAVKFSLYTVTVISAAGILGIPYASLIAVLGSAGVAVGLALQGSLSNIAASILILINKPFKAGDFIEAAGIQGTVSEIGFFSTSLITMDNKVISYPNSALSNTCITNYSAMPERMVNIKFGVSYDSDTDAVRAVMCDTAAAHPLVLKNRDVFARISAYADSSIEFTLRVWCKTEDYWTVYFDMQEEMKKAFDKNGIEIPYPKLEVNIKK